MTAKACYLHRESLLELRGAKIAAFLQGQLTCDTRNLSVDMAVPGAFCTPKGRVITDLWLLYLDEDYAGLRLRASVAQKTQNVLQRYAQFSRISVDGKHALADDPADDRANSPANGPAGIVGIYGAQASDMTHAAIASLPAQPGASCATQDLFWLRRGPRHGEVGALTVRGERELADIISALGAGDERHWQAEDLLQGHYSLEDSDSERFTPQTLNYDLTPRVAFDKGCYTGQEVVARLHYKGQSKRRLRILRSRAALTAGVGSHLLGPKNDHSGTVLRAQQDQSGATIVAAEVLVSAANDGLRTVEGIALEPLAELA